MMRDRYILMKQILYGINKRIKLLQFKRKQKGRNTKDEEKIILALKLQKKTGVPTWVGAQMPGDYNDGDNYSVSEQVVFAKFVADELDKGKIPFAVNSDTKFYDRQNNKWYAEMIPVLNAIGFSKNTDDSVDNDIPPTETKTQWIKD